MQLVSVIVPVYNNKDYLKAAMDSVVNMNYKEIEFIVVDDGSTDGSSEIVSDYMSLDSRIRLFKHIHNRGTNYAIKTAIRNSGGRYIFIAAADDISLPDRIEKCLDVFASDPQVGIVASNAVIIDRDGNETEEAYEIDSYITNDNIAINQFKRNYCLGAAMAMINNKDILLKDDMLRYTDDYEIALEYLMNDYKIFILRENTVKYRIHEGNFSNNKRLLNEKMIKVLQKYDLKDIYENLRSKSFDEKEILVALGIIELMKKEYLSGCKLLAKADEMKTADIRIEFENKFYLGVAGYKLDNLRLSYENFGLAYELNSSEPTVLNNFGILHHILGIDKALGRDMLTRSMDIKPDYIDARVNRESMDKKAGQYRITERILDACRVSRSKYCI